MLFETFNIENQWLSSGERRLNASSYAKGSIKMLNLLDKLKRSGLNIENLSIFSDNIFAGKRSKRLFTTQRHGLPYLMPIDLFAFKLKPRKWIRRETKDLKNWRVSENIILISQSGTLGRVLITNKLFKDIILSQNIIRYVPNEVGLTKIGYIFAYLSSWMGQALITKDQYGAAIRHIEPHHIANIPIPIVPVLEDTINQKILEAHRLREEAQELLLRAELLLFSELKLPEIDEEDIEYFDAVHGATIKSFEVNVSELNMRLDASYHLPLAHLAVKKINETECGTAKRLEEVAYPFLPHRFKRPYVKSSSDGVHLLQGSHIALIKPLGIKYIWNKMKNLQSYIVKRNWLLVTCSGTIGKLSMVREQWNGWAATNHLLRIVPNETKKPPENNIHPGYLNVFLLSVYGQVQFQSRIYGGVVDEIGEAGELVNDIFILKPKDKRIENKIGDIVFQAYDKRDKANQLEKDAINILESKIKELTHFDLA